MLDSFCNLLQKKMKFQQGERDMAFMFHEVLVSSSSGKRGRLTSTLIQYGESAGYTAMAKTVSIPAAMAVEMLLQGRISQKGVLAPLDKSIYNQLLGQLENENIRFKETISAL